MVIHVCTHSFVGKFISRACKLRAWRTRVEGRRVTASRSSRSVRQCNIVSDPPDMSVSFPDQPHPLYLTLDYPTLAEKSQLSRPV